MNFPLRALSFGDTQAHKNGRLKSNFAGHAKIPSGQCGSLLFGDAAGASLARTEFLDLILHGTIICLHYEDRLSFSIRDKDKEIRTMNLHDVFTGTERGQKGVTTVEYAVMLVLVAIAVLAFGTEIGR